jgi:hypothetical protein
MDTKQLFVKAITLLYRESEILNNVNRSYDLVKSVLNIVKPTDPLVASGFGQDPLSGLREILTSMVSMPIDHVFDKTELLQRCRLSDEMSYDSVRIGIDHPMEESYIKSTCTATRNKLKAFVKEDAIKSMLKTAYHTSTFHPELVDWRHFVKELMEKLEPYAVSDGSGVKHPSIVNEINFNDKDALAAVFRRSQEETSTAGVIRFGHQGINRMFGAAGGGRRGEFVVVGALPHMFKSGTALEMFKAGAIYNTPYMLDKAKIPCLFRISFENDTSIDIPYLYKSLVENETGILVNLNTVDPVEAATYVHEKLKSGGYEVILKQIDPSDFTYHDLFEEIELLEAKGFEVHMLNIDYLNMMSKRGCNAGPAGTDIRDLFRRVRNFCLRKKILCITPHQLSPAAKQLFRDGVENFTAQVAGKGYYDGCSTIDQEVDMEIFQHIVEQNGEFYLTMSRGKHRAVDFTPVADRNTVYKFEAVGGLKCDVDGRDMSRSRVGAAPISEGGTLAWHHEV